MSSFLIVGLGNPGNAYRNTRHNLGFEVVRAFAKKRNLSFRDAPNLVGQFAQGEIDDKKLYLLLPTTLMNNSGDAVRRCIDYYQISVHQLLIVCDDIALPLGSMRIRAQGSAGGHNGLKSIETHLRTRYYSRFRMGVGHAREGDLSDHVLGHFSSQERPIVDQVVEKGSSLLLVYARQGLAAAMQIANAREKIVESENQEK